MTVRRAQPTWRAAETGVATVEFAIGVIVILFTMLAVVEVGRVFYSYNTLNKAIRNGARFASSNVLGDSGLPVLTPAVEANIQNMVVYSDENGGRPPVLSNFPLNTVTTTLDDAGGAFGSWVRVHAAYPYEPLFSELSNFGFGPNLDLTFTMTAASTMRVIK